MDNIEIEKTSAPTGEAMPIATPEQQPAAMPTPTPTPIPVAEPTPIQPIEQPISTPQQSAPQMERMQMPMQPIDLSGQSETPMQSTSSEGGSNKKLIIIAIVVLAGVAAGVGGFFIWRMMNAPVEEVPVVAQPITTPTLPPVTEQVLVPQAPVTDDISVIEQDMNTFNAAPIDAELQTGLDEITRSL